MELTAGKVAVVTGAASGIGLALAERFARAGLDVPERERQEIAAAAHFIEEMAELVRGKRAMSAESSSSGCAPVCRALAVVCSRNSDCRRPIAPMSYSART